MWKQSGRVQRVRHVGFTAGPVNFVRKLNPARFFRLEHAARAVGSLLVAKPREGKRVDLSLLGSMHRGGRGGVHWRFGIISGMRYSVCEKL